MEEIKQNQVILSLGSNIGDRKAYLLEAKCQLIDLVGPIVDESLIYISEAWGLKFQSDFLNQVVIIQTSLSPHDLLRKCTNIEASLKRVRNQKWGPRTIDVDILYYNNQIINDIHLVIPHPRIQDRKFVLIPLHDIVPEFEHPILRMTTEEMIKICNDSSNVTLYNS